jgi:hypothetical protein
MDDDPGAAIGGLDILFNVDDEPPQQIIQKVRETFARHWPLAVYEFASADPGHIEFFVYRNRYWRKKWDDLGAVGQNSNTMFHFLTSPGDMTLVIDSVNIDTKPIIDEIINKLATSPAEYCDGKKYSYAS